MRGGVQGLALREEAQKREREQLAWETRVIAYAAMNPSLSYADIGRYFHRDGSTIRRLLARKRP